MDSFLKKEQRLDAQKRGSVLMKLYLTDPLPLTDKTLLVELNLDYKEYNFTLIDVQRALKYLEGHNLVTIKFLGPDWVSTITSRGVDYCQGIGEEMLGVFRG